MYKEMRTKVIMTITKKMKGLAQVETEKLNIGENSASDPDINYDV